MKKEEKKVNQSEENTQDVTEKTKTADPETDKPNAEAEKLSAELAEKDRKIADLTDKYQRSIAEFDNLRKRTRKEKEAIYPDAVCSAVKALLPVLDSLERAEKQDCRDEEYKKGVTLVCRQFADALEKLGVRATGEAGETFDPNVHEAVLHVEDENFGENVVCEVFTRGYVLGDKIIRAAMVKVAN